LTAVSALVAEFAARHLQSLDDLQVLIACMEAGDRWWSAASTAGQLGISPVVAARSLDHLARQNLFDIRVSNAIAYRYAPGTPQLDEEAQAMLAEYRRNPLGVVKLVTGRSSARDFADAFRIRRHDDR
jgi:hypothetical protein